MGGNYELIDQVNRNCANGGDSGEN